MRPHTERATAAACPHFKARARARVPRPALLLAPPRLAGTFPRPAVVLSDAATTCSNTRGLPRSGTRGHYRPSREVCVRRCCDRVEPGHSSISLRWTVAGCLLRCSAASGVGAPHRSRVKARDSALARRQRHRTLLRSCSEVPQRRRWVFYALEHAEKQTRLRPSASLSPSHHTPRAIKIRFARTHVHSARSRPACSCCSCSCSTTRYIHATTFHTAQHSRCCCCCSASADIGPKSRAAWRRPHMGVAQVSACAVALPHRSLTHSLTHRTRGHIHISP